MAKRENCLGENREMRREKGRRTIVRVEKKKENQGGKQMCRERRRAEEIRLIWFCHF